MKKSGFTLAELVITLSIIGIASAIVAPALTNLIPDRNKAIVLKYYSTINNTMNDIFNDERIYHPSTGYTVSGTETTYFLTKDGSTACEGISCINGNFPEIFIQRMGSNDPQTRIILSGDVDAGYIFTIDTDTTKIGTRFIGSMKNVDTFVLKMDKYGKLSAGDALTDAYLKNPLNLNDKKTDFKVATQNISKAY